MLRRLAAGSRRCPQRTETPGTRAVGWASRTVLQRVERNRTQPERSCHHLSTSVEGDSLHRLGFPPLEHDRASLSWGLGRTQAVCLHYPLSWRGCYSHRNGASTHPAVSRSLV